LDLFDFPGSDGTFTVLIKILALFSSNPSEVMNLFYICGFVMIYTVAYFVLRDFKITTPWAIVGAIIYTCMPFHFMRGMNHLYLSNYFVIPIWVWLAVRIYELSGPKAEDCRNPSWLYLPALIVAGTSGVYYAFFGMLITSVAAVVGMVENRSWRGIKYWLPLVMIVCLAILINISPSLVYWFQYGTNPTVATRSAYESDFYGLRIMQLLLPTGGRNNHILDNFGYSYRSALTPTEAGASSLGIVGSVGFILMFAVVFLGEKISKNPKVTILAKINLAVILYGTVGGFSVLFALLVTPEFRTPNRLSIYIAFISVLGLFLYVRSFMEDKSWTGGKPLMQWAFAALIGLFAVYDQIPLGARYTTQSTVFVSEFKTYMQALESRLPSGSMIYVMPYLPFPETAPLYEEGSYNLLRPYYYSTTLRWSYGAMKGNREGDIWAREVESLPLVERLAVLKKAGFSGVFIDRKAYRDSAAQLESQLKPLVDGAAFEDPSQRYAFYPITPDSSPELTPKVGMSPGKGFYGVERNDKNTWTWSSGSAEYHLWNFTNRPVHVTLKGTLDTLGDRHVDVEINGQSIAKANSKVQAVTPLDIRLELPPGLSRIVFQSKDAPVRFASDPRLLSFRIIDLKISVE
jgi:phosphoglycerol transferase